MCVRERAVESRMCACRILVECAARFLPARCGVCFVRAIGRSCAHHSGFTQEVGSQGVCVHSRRRFFVILLIDSKEKGWRDKGAVAL